MTLATPKIVAGMTLALLAVAGCSGGASVNELIEAGEETLGVGPVQPQPGATYSPLAAEDLGPLETTATDQEATPRLAEDATLQEYIEYGLRNSPAVRQAFDRWRAAMQRIPQARALPDPMLQFNYFVSEIETRVGPQEAQVMLSQQIPWFGKLRLRGSVAAADAEKQWWQLQGRRLVLVQQIRDAWFEYAFLGQNVRITRESLTLLKQLEPIVQRRVQGGADQSALLRLQVEIGKLENNVTSLLSRRPVLSARLDALLNREATEPLPWPAAPEVVARVPEREAVLARLEHGNTQLETLRREVERERRKVALARREGYPDFTTGVLYLPTSERSVDVPDNGEDAWAVTLGVKLPLWRGKYRAAVAEAQASRDAANAGLRQTQNDLRSEADTLLFRIDDSRRQMSLYEDSLLPRARQALQVARAAYQGGTGSVLEIIDSQRTLLQFENAYWRAATNHVQSLAEMEALLGGDLP